MHFRDLTKFGDGGPRIRRFHLIEIAIDKSAVVFLQEIKKSLSTLKANAERSDLVFDDSPG